MSARNSATGWGWVARTFHWTTAVLVAIQLGIALRIMATDDLVRRYEATQWHKGWGTAILAVVALRLLWRAADRVTPATPPAMPRWQVRAARLSHALLYLLLVVLPLAGWVYVSASPLQSLMQVENRVFGLFALPDPWPAGNERLADAAHALHVAAALAFVAVLAVHVGAALRHHFVARDDVLARMTRGW